MKKFAFLMVVLLLVAAMVLPSCKAAPAEVTEWQMLHITTGDTLPEPVAVFTFIDQVWEESGQTLKITSVPKGEVGYKGPEVRDLIRDGTLQIATTTGGYYPDEPLLDIAGMMFQLTLEEGSTALTAARPYFEQVWDKYNAKLLGNGFFPNALWSTKPLYKLEDFQGMKFRATPRPVQMAWESVGGATVTLTTGDIYMALQTGMIDAAALALFNGIFYNFYEVCDYVIVDPIVNASSVHLIVNKDAFNALPQEIQGVLIEAGKEFQRTAIRENGIQLGGENIELLKSQGCTPIFLSGDELAKIRQEMAIPGGLKWAEEKGVTEAVQAVNKALGR